MGFVGIRDPKCLREEVTEITSAAYNHVQIALASLDELFSVIGLVRQPVLLQMENGGLV